jgi:hypothetical protein
MEKIKYEPIIDLFPKGESNSYLIDPLKGNVVLNITTTVSRGGDKVILFMSNLGSPKNVTFDVGFDVSPIPIDRTGYLELIFNGTSFVAPFIGNLKGEKGDTGPRGPQGEKGDTGLTGIQGANGTSGSSGISIQGPQGERGISGSSGTSGISIQGPQGERGEDGMNGVNGRSCNCEFCQNER